MRKDPVAYKYSSNNESQAPEEGQDEKTEKGKKPVSDWIKDKLKSKKDKIKEEDPNIYPLFSGHNYRGRMQNWDHARLHS